MANIENALARTLKNEGVYSDDPQDAGGETCYGISRRYHPNWQGWQIIDSFKPRVGVINPAAIVESTLVHEQVTSFYKSEFWDKFLGDSFTDQPLANAVFDCAVNVDVETAVFMLQRALNVCNRNATAWDDITVDGHVGPATLKAEAAQKGTKPYNMVQSVFNFIRGYHYVELMEADHKKERWVGWFSRCVVITG